MPYWKRLTPSTMTPLVGGVHGVPPAPEPPMPSPAPPLPPPWPSGSIDDDTPQPPPSRHTPASTIGATGRMTAAIRSDKRDFIGVHTPRLFRGDSGQTRRLPRAGTPADLQVCSLSCRIRPGKP